MAVSGSPGPTSGFPSPAADYEEGRIDLNRELIPSPLSTFFMRVQGDAMRGDGIFHGDLLVIDRSVHPQAGSVVVAVFEGRFILRRLCPCPGEQRGRVPSLRLEASDGERPPIDLDNGQGGAELWGVVIHAVHHLLAPQAASRSMDLQEAGSRKEGAIRPRRRSSC